MRTTLTTLVVLMITTLPAAAAQTLTGPAEDHARDKASAATQSPVGFVQDHASEEAVVREAEWGIAYGCHAIDYAHDEHGTPDPELEQCENYEQALGIEEEPKEELPEAVAENLTEGPVAEVKDLTDDALDTAGRIADEPTSALEEILGLLGRALAAAGRIVGGATLLLLFALTTALQAAPDLADGTLATAAMIVDSLDLATTTASTSASNGLGMVGTLFAILGQSTGSVVGALSSAMAAVGSGIATAVGAVGHGLGAAGDAIADTVQTIGTTLGDLVDSLLGRDASDTASSDDIGAPELPVGTGGLLPDVDKIVDDLA